MIHGEDGQIQCNNCRSIEVKSNIYLDKGRAYEMFACKECGHTTYEDVPLKRETPQTPQEDAGNNG